MPATRIEGSTQRAGQRPLPFRRGRSWEAQQVAAHLMACRAQIVCGLRRRTPWAGLDDDTLDSCFGHGAAVIAQVAASGERPDWRSVKDLEKAQIAAFRHQALDHWKRANALSRQGDRHAVLFDPERHAAAHAPLERLFAGPDLHEIARDLLADLDDGELRAFWALVLGEGLTFKPAGDRLGLTKAEVMARTRAGRSTFARHLERRESGELCRDRSRDIAARRAGSADEAGVERAAAHLECCYACALVHQPQQGGAFERGLLGMGPVALVLRLTTEASQRASSVAARWSSADAGARLAAGGLAALTVAGSGVALHAATDAPGLPSASRATAVSTPAPVPVRDSFQAPARLVVRRPAAVSAHAASPRSSTRSRTSSPRAAAATTTTTTASAATPASVATAATAPVRPTSTGPEFSVERPGASTAAPTAPEFPTP